MRGIEKIKRRRERGREKEVVRERKRGRGRKMIKLLKKEENVKYKIKKIGRASCRERVSSPV